jgi:hypothetical protein
MDVIGFLYHQIAAQLSFMTVQVADARAHVQRLVSVVEMATMLEECTTKEQLPVVRFLWAKGLNAKDIHKAMFPFYDGKCLSRKAVHNWVENSLKDVRKSQMIPDQIALLRLRQKQLCSGWKS